MYFHFAAMWQDFEPDLNIGLWNQFLRPFRPFNEKNIVSVEFIAKACSFPFFLVAQTVQIEVAQV